MARLFQRFRRYFLTVFFFLFYFFQSFLSFKIDPVLLLYIFIHILPAFVHVLHRLHSANLQELSSDVIVIVTLHLKLVVFVDLFSHRQFCARFYRFWRLVGLIFKRNWLDIHFFRLLPPLYSFPSGHKPLLYNFISFSGHASIGLDILRRPSPSVFTAAFHFLHRKILTRIEDKPVSIRPLFFFSFFLEKPTPSS